MKRFTMFFVAVFALCTLVACQGGTITVDSISIQGQDTELNVGEKFSTGALAVTAHYSDDSTADVTDKAEIIQNVNMNQAGAYLVVVLYEGANATYEVKVVAPEATLVAIDVNAENAKTEYIIGEELSTEGLVVYETYSDGSIIKVTDLAAYEVEGLFAKIGKQVVKVSKGELEATYEVEVAAKSYSTVAEAIEAAVANADKAISGSVTFDYGWYSNTQNYEFGKDYTKLYDDYEANYYFETEDGLVYGITVGTDYETGEESLTPAYEPTYDHLLGVNFNSVLYGEYYPCGVEDFVTYLYELAQTETNVSFEEELLEVCNHCGQTNVYSFSFEGFVEGSYFFISVEFTNDLVNENFSEVLVDIKGYYSYNLVQDEEGNYSVSEEVTEYDFEKGVVINQVSGERTLENPYKLEELLYSSFDLEDAEGNEAQTEYTVKAGETINLYVANVQPATAVASLNEIIVEYDNYDYTLFGSEYEGVISLTPYGARTYNVTLTCGSIVYEIKITSVEPDPESITTYVYQYVEGWWGPGYEPVEANSATVEVGAPLYVSAEVNPSKANQEYTYSIKENAENASLKESNDSDYTVPTESLTFVANVVGTYVLEFVSVKDPSITAEITVEVIESEKEPVTLEGTWKASFTNYRTGMTYNFTLVLNANGTGTFTCYEVENLELTYVVEENTIIYTILADWSGSLEGCTVNLVDGTMALTVNTTDGGFYPLTFEKEIETEEEATLVGEWSGTYPHPMNPALPCSVSITFNEDGTGLGVINGTDVTFTYTDNGDSISFTNVLVASEGVEISFSIATYEDGYASVTMFITINSTMQTVVLTK